MRDNCEDCGLPITDSHVAFAEQWEPGRAYVCYPHVNFGGEQLCAERTVERLRAQLSVATARAEAAEAKVARLLARRFPVLDGGMSVPWGLVEPHEQQAIDNHSQSLKRLAERGGLSWAELNCVLECRRWRRDEPSDEAAKALVLKRVAEYEAAQWVRENSPPQKKPTDEGGRGGR